MKQRTDWPTINSVLGDNERSSAYAAEQRRMVRAAVAAEVLTYTPYWRDAATEAGIRSPTDVTDLLALPARPLSALGSPDVLVLRPSPDAVRRSGPRPLRRRLRRARLGRGRATASLRILDPLYKPVQWMIEEDTPVGWTESDLIRLAELGRRSLDLAGVGANDAIVGLVPLGPTLPTWQLTLGAREAGIPLAGLPPSTSLEAVTTLGPTVLAGRPADVIRVLKGAGEAVRSGVVTVLAVARTPLEPKERMALEAAAGSQASVVEVWSPPGVRALWTQCRGGEGVHTWPQSEMVEVCDRSGTPVAAGEEGELVWTGLGWRGTVFVRLATGMRGRVVEGRCPTCGRTTPRVLDAYPTAQSTAAKGNGRKDTPISPATPTGDFESVRKMAPARKDSAAPDVAKAKEVSAAAVREAGRDNAPAPVRAVPKDEAAGVVRAAAKDEPAMVRAVPRDDAGDGPGSTPGRADRPSAIGAVDHLPPVPEVGPDASGDDPAEGGHDPWLPETGEVDAWPAPVLASIAGLAAWQVEHRRRRGHDDELVVHLALAEGAELGEVLVSLERSVGATQYVVRDEGDIAARITAADGRRIVDRRARRRPTVSARRAPRAR